MMILGPLVAPRTSTVTPALSRPVAFTVSPSTVITTGRVSVSPTAASVLSISMTSPTATFCCLLPLRTIAYTADSLSLLVQVCGARCKHAEGQLYGVAALRVKTSHPAEIYLPDVNYYCRRDRDCRPSSPLRSRPPALPLGGAVEHHDRDADGHHQLLDRHHLAAGDLPRHPPRPAGARERRLPALDHHGLPGGLRR